MSGISGLFDSRILALVTFPEVNVSVVALAVVVELELEHAAAATTAAASGSKRRDVLIRYLRIVTGRAHV